MCVCVHLKVNSVCVCAPQGEQCVCVCVHLKVNCMLPVHLKMNNVSVCAPPGEQCVCVILVHPQVNSASV